jgi:hypothetical protein
MVTKFTVSRAEFQMEAGFSQAEFSLFRDTNGFLDHLFKALLPVVYLEARIAEAINLMDEEGQPQSLSTRLGLVNGQLKRTTITIIADDGNSIDVEATVFVSADWTAGNFLGYAGLLERVRFAVDRKRTSFI